MRHHDPFPLRRGAHPAAVRSLHWVMAAAVLVEFALALARMAAEPASLRSVLLSWHEPVGLLIGALTLVRVGVRLQWRLAAWNGPVSRSMAWGSAAVHGISYLLMLGLPILGWALVNARGHAVALPGLGALPRLLPSDPDLADTLQDWHGDLAWVLLGLIGVHVAAAAWHQWMCRDGLLYAMWPRRTSQISSV